MSCGRFPAAPRLDMFKIALTGGIACGKSLVGSILRKHGAAVCESDQIAHALILPGEPAYAEVVEAFGMDILNADGVINRAQLGERVFADAEARMRLNAIVHPRVKAVCDAWLAETAATGAHAMAVVVIPLLFEAGMDAGWDAILCVRSPVDLQQTRMLGRGLSPSQVEQRLAAQLPVDEKARRADFVIENDCTETELERRTLDVVGRIRESKHGRAAK